MEHNSYFPHHRYILPFLTVFLPLQRSIASNPETPSVIVVLEHPHDLAKAEFVAMFNPCSASERGGAVIISSMRPVNLERLQHSLNGFGGDGRNLKTPRPDFPAVSRHYNCFMF
jgi:hypothetical protein